MLTVSIPGRETLELNYLVLDYNGTIAVDGALLPGVADRLAALKDRLEILVLTADTYGTVREQCAPLGVEVRTFPREGAAACKAEIVRELGGGAVCLGNGFIMVDIDINYFLAYSLCNKAEANMGANMACADNNNFSFSDTHLFFLLNLLNLLS